MSGGEPMFAQGFPFFLVGLKIVDSPSLGMNARHFKSRSLFTRVSPGRGRAVEG